jgi:hypothetical protein
MGCDIHIYREKKVGDQWVTADKWTPYDYGDDDKGVRVEWGDRAYTGRNYDLFGLLSQGARHEHEFSFEPRGLPFNACPEIQQESARWGVDGHSHSYLYLHELKEMAAFLETNTIEISGLKNADELKALRESIASGSPNWNLIFPYCQGTSDPTYERFAIDVPADFCMGGCLAKIINSFEGVDGENHRIVFFFDN